MQTLVMSAGTLKRKADAYKRITNSVILGSLEDTPFTDVEVVTLKQHARDCAYEQLLTSNVLVSSYEDIQLKVIDLLKTSFQEGQEFVKVEENRILVGIDTDKIDDRAVDSALLLLVEMEDFSVGTHLLFGETLKLNT